MTDSDEAFLNRLYTVQAVPDYPVSLSDDDRRAIHEFMFQVHMWDERGRYNRQGMRAIERIAGLDMAAERRGPREDTKPFYDTAGVNPKGFEHKLWIEEQRAADPTFRTSAELEEEARAKRQDFIGAFVFETVGISHWESGVRDLKDVAAVHLGPKIK